MKQILATITVVATLAATSASAFDPVHLKKLWDTNSCIECDLSGAYLFNADLAGAILTEAELQEAELVGAILAGAKLVNVNLTNAVLGGADLTGADLTGTNFRKADMNFVNMKGAILCNTTMPDGSVIYSGC